MSKIYTITNNKGGVTKTTSTISLGAALARKGYKVLLIDTDTQSNLTTSLGFLNPDDMKSTLSAMMEMEIERKSYSAGDFGIVHHREGFDVLPSNHDLIRIQMSLGELKRGEREFVFSRCIEKIKDNYEYILVDCKPSTDLMTPNVLSAVGKVIVPVIMDPEAIHGLEETIRMVGKVKKKLNPGLGIGGILFANFNANTRFGKRIVEELKLVYGSKIGIFDSIIPPSIRVPESANAGITIFKHNPSGTVAHAYDAFAEEVIRRG